MSGSRLRSFAEVRLGRQRSPQNAQGPSMVRYLRAANVKAEALDLTDVKEMNFSPSEQEVFALRRGDVIVTEGAGSLAAVGASTAWNDDLPGLVCIQNTLVRLRPRRAVADSRYLFWWVQHAHASGMFASVAAGVNIFHLGAERVGELPAPFPSITQQRAIADFLDAETARIDAITAARERQLHLLAARSRQAISSRLLHDVTDFVALRRVATIQGGLTINSARARDASSVDRPYLRVANVQDGHIDVTEVARVIVPRSLATQATLRPGDVLIAEGNGNPANLGRGAVWRGEIPGCLHQNHVHAIRPHSDVLDSDYLALLTRTTHARDYFASVSAQVGIATLSKQKVMDLRVPGRDIGKQRRVVQLIKSEQSLVQQLGELTRSQIRLLLEHRQALITAAVTGAIDVSTASGRGVSA